MGITSINEPDGPGRTTMLTPMSINEPLTAADVPAPVIDTLDPASCVIGDADFMLVINGSNFLPEVTTIYFAGYDEPTTFNNTGSVQTVVKPSLWGDPVVVDVQVHNGDVWSNMVQFSFDAPANMARRKDPAEASHAVTENVSRERSEHGHGGSHRRGGRSSRR
jgi:hypothetical protein